MRRVCVVWLEAGNRYAFGTQRAHIKLGSAAFLFWVGQKTPHGFWMPTTHLHTCRGDVGNDLESWRIWGGNNDNNDDRATPLFPPPPQSEGLFGKKKERSCGLHTRFSLSERAACLFHCRFVVAMVVRLVTRAQCHNLPHGLLS